MKPSTIWAPRVLSVLRIIVGLVLLQYGLAKLLGWPAVQIFEELKLFSLFGIAGIFELVGGTLLVLGLFTRPVAFILSGEMAAAYFIEHFPHSFFPIQNEGDLAVTLCFTFLYLSFAGGGPWSLDAIMGEDGCRASSPRIGFRELDTESRAADRAFSRCEMGERSPSCSVSVVSIWLRRAEDHSASTLSCAPGPRLNRTCADLGKLDASDRFGLAAVDAGSQNSLPMIRS